MKKTFLFLLFMIIIIINIYAQDNSTEAIAAYQIAEESYEKGDFPTALRFLETAKKNLGTTNSKLMYLKIQIEMELYKTDKNLYEQMMKSINQFQTAPDIKNFNKDKVLEVMKLKMMLADEHETETTKALENQVFEKEFAATNMQYWPLIGSSVAELKKERPAFFNKEYKSPLENGIEVFVNLKFKESFCVKNNIVYSASQNVFDGPDDINFTKTKDLLNILLTDLNKKLTTKSKETSLNGEGYTSTTYTWTSGSKNITVICLFMANLKQGQVILSFVDLDKLN